MASKMLSVYLLTAVLAFGAAVSGQVPTPTDPQQQQQAPPPQEPAPPAGVVDDVFVAQTIRNCRAEAELSKMALNKSISPDVKILAQRLVDDHAKMMAELSAFASAKKTILPDDPAPKDKLTLDRLEKLTGEAFDRTYVTQVIADHRRDIEAFKEYGEKAADAVLKAWAAKTLPMLQHHLEMAREAEKKLQS